MGYLCVTRWPVKSHFRIIRCPYLCDDSWQHSTIGLDGGKTISLSQCFWNCMLCRGGITLIRWHCLALSPNESHCGSITFTAKCFLALSSCSAGRSTFATARMPLDGINPIFASIRQQLQRSDVYPSFVEYMNIQTKKSLTLDNQLSIRHLASFSTPRRFFFHTRSKLTMPNLCRNKPFFVATKITMHPVKSMTALQFAAQPRISSPRDLDIQLYCAPSSRSGTSQQ